MHLTLAVLVIVAIPIVRRDCLEETDYAEMSGIKASLSTAMPFSTVPVILRIYFCHQSFRKVPSL